MATKSKKQNSLSTFQYGCMAMIDPYGTQFKLELK